MKVDTSFTASQTVKVIIGEGQSHEDGTQNGERAGVHVIFKTGTDQWPSLMKPVPVHTQGMFDLTLNVTEIPVYMN